jgi:protein-disulfide isomerase
MRYFKKIILVFILSAFICLPVRAEMTLNELFFDESKPFHLKILDVIPAEGIIQMGDENAKNTIIEFMDYFCGYCKKVHPELMQIASEREDTRIIFLQHPILSESSKLLANMAIAANIQNKGIDFHNALFEVEGNLNNEKLKQIIKNLELNDAKLNIDITKDEINNIVKLSSFLANGSGARGTPTFFVNEEFVVGYISIDRIKALLK